MSHSTTTIAAVKRADGDLAHQDVQAASNVSRDTIQHIPLDTIQANPHQPRTDFGDLDGLAKSIRQHDVQQPITLSDNGDGSYTLIAGERRLRAARLAKLKTIPAVIRTGDPAILGLLENIQREDLKPLEEAEAFQKLLDRGETQQSIADKLGIGRSYVAQKVRLLELPTEARLLLEGASLAKKFGAISESAARQMLRLQLLNHVATTKVPESWANKYAHMILWHWRYRTTADVQFGVDEVLTLLLWGVRFFGNITIDEAKQKAEEKFEATDISMVRRVSSFQRCLCPDYSRLSDSQLADLEKAACRWNKEQDRRFGPQEVEEAAE